VVHEVVGQVREGGWTEQSACGGVEMEDGAWAFLFGFGSLWVGTTLFEPQAVIGSTELALESKILHLCGCPGRQPCLPGTIYIT
jgi:hypothetical protein